MKIPSIKSVFSRLLVKDPLLNKPAIHADTEPETNNIWLPFFSIGLWYQPLLKSISTLPNRVASFFAGLVYDSYDFIQKNKHTGITSNTGEYENRKLAIIKQLNIFQLFTGIIVPISVFFSHESLSAISALIYVFPPLINFLVLYLDSKQRKLEAMIAYFALYPFFTNLAYIDSFSLGTELFFVLYSILSVFFLQQAAHIVFCITFNMVNYLMLIIMLKKYQTQHGEDNHPFFFMLNHVVAVAVIFYSLYLIKKENAGYQASILEKNTELQLINEEVKKQKEEIAEKASQLEEQAIRLNKIDAFKNKLFSIVSHDLKAPLHALKNLFAEIKQQNLPAEEIIELVPDVIKDLNYATWLTENLLNWAKTQMHAETMHPQAINVTAMINEIMQQQRLQAELKDITIKVAIGKKLFIYADSDMVKLVVRNILSNAIKFTPQGGSVTIGTNAVHSHVEIFIEDTGSGMDAEALAKLKNDDYFTTRGTANEQGTGLGLMLCKEFLEKNNGQLHIESEKGKGSIFSFTLPRAND